jgi:hypothetical protein
MKNDYHELWLKLYDDILGIHTERFKHLTNEVNIFSIY